jgi:hypothetical protein
MHRRVILFALISIALTSQAMAESVCHRVFENFNWFDGSIVEKCNAGDILMVQMTEVAPGAVVARYCDLRFSIFSETRSVGRDNQGRDINQVTIVCKLRK